MNNSQKSLSEAMCQAHTALLRDLENLQEAVRSQRGEVTPKLYARLLMVQQHLTEHFRFEEQNGYMEAVRKRAPHLERVIQHLLKEHRQLAESLDALIAKTEEGKGQDTPLLEEIREWIERVRQHESRENLLVEDAYNLDIGAED